MKGILFTPDNIELIVEGRKTQTRRIIKPQPYNFEPPIITYKEERINIEDLSLYARYQVGEVVYIKEKITRKRNDPSVGYDYATYALDLTPVMFYLSANRFVWYWQKDYLSPLHLPQQAARHFITITDVRAERLQKVTAEDMIREGISGYTLSRGVLADNPPDQRWKFIELWDSINKPPYDWNSNPWCFVYSFCLTNKKTKKEASE